MSTAPLERSRTRGTAVVRKLLRCAMKAAMAAVEQPYGFLSAMKCAASPHRVLDENDWERNVRDLIYEEAHIPHQSECATQ